MRKVGGYMIFFGLFAIVLDYIERVPTILMWIYEWGDTIAWVIKIGLVAIGAVLYFMGTSKTEEIDSDEESEDEPEEKPTE